MKHVQSGLFIGGPSDGIHTTYAKTWESDQIGVPVYSKTQYVDDYGLPLEPNFDKCTYRREYLKAGDNLFVVWVLEGMPIEDAMTRLLECYRPEPAVTPC